MYRDAAKDDPTTAGTSGTSASSERGQLWQNHRSGTAPGRGGPRPARWVEPTPPSAKSRDVEGTPGKVHGRRRSLRLPTPGDKFRSFVSLSIHKGDKIIIVMTFQSHFNFSEWKRPNFRFNSFLFCPFLSLSRSAYLHFPPLLINYFL